MRRTRATAATKTAEGKADLAMAKQYLMDWISHLSPWVVIHGGPGTGKTTMLYALKNNLFNMAFYITLPDLQDRLHQYVYDNEMLSEFIAALHSAPVLLLDDLGLEYGKDQFTAQKLTAIINFRYIYASKLPVIVTTNYEPKNFTGSDDLNVRRLADRLLDGQSTDILQLRAESYRLATVFE
jgi:DNA replication protein DnaC